MDAEQRMKKSMWGQFWSAHQRFFKYLCIASKVRRVVQLAREDVQNGKVRLAWKYLNIVHSELLLWESVEYWPALSPPVCGDRSAVHRRSKNTWGPGGRRRRAKWLCVNRQVRTHSHHTWRCSSSTAETMCAVAVIKCLCCRGVLQSLIEKHFPAPDRQKLYSLLGIDLSAKKTPSPSDTAAEPKQKGKKRKGTDQSWNMPQLNLWGRQTCCWNTPHSSRLFISVGSEVKKQQKKRPRKHGGLSGTSSEESQSEESDKESGKDSDDSFKSVSSADEDDDFNPFRDESDDDGEDGEEREEGWALEMFHSLLIERNKPFYHLCLDPWLIRKEPKKGKEKKKKKRRKSIDPDSIQSALLASGLGSSRPAFTAPVIPPSTPSAGKHGATWRCWAVTLILL